MKTVTLISIFALLIGCDYFSKRSSSVPLMISISSDGKNIISSHRGGSINLWDRERKNITTIASSGTGYSPYFIKNKDIFLYQESKSNIVHVQTINGKPIKDIKLSFPVYGNLLSTNLSTYIASDADWNLYSVKNNQQKIIKRNDGGPGGIYESKLFNLSSIDNILLSSGSGSGQNKRTLSDGPNLHTSGEVTNPHYNRSLWAGVMLWDINKGKPIARLDGNVAKTFATLSPDGEHVVSVDENGLCFVWNTKTGKEEYLLARAGAGVFLHNGAKKLSNRFDKTHLPDTPKDFCRMYGNYCHKSNAKFAIKFITKNKFLVFSTGIPYATLYDIHSPYIRKFIKLTGHPRVNGYIESNVIDTAPQAGILVMAPQPQEYTISDKYSGLLVYQFSDKDETLKLIWTPKGPPPHKVKKT